MTRRYASLLLTAALGMAAAQTAPTPVTSVSDSALSGAGVTFQISRAGNDLTSMLIALAKSVGYELIIEPSADDVLRAAGSGTTGGAAAASTVTYAFTNKPFNQVWPLVLDLYGLSYESLSLGGKTVLRVGVKPIQKIVKLPSGLVASAVERQLKLSFGTPQTAQTSQTAPAAQGAATTAAGTTTTTTQTDVVLDSKTLRIVAEPSSNSIIIRGTNQEVAQVQALLDQIIATQPAGTQAAAPIPSVQRIYSVNSSAADITALLGAQFPTLRVTAVGTSGQIVITGAQDQVDAALALLGQVDRAPTPTATATTAQQVYTVKGQQADAVALLGAQFPALKVTPVGQTGQLVINGPQDQLTAALALLGQVDRPASAAPTTVQRVFTLVNASAEEVKATLEGTLARALSDAGTTTSPNVPVTGTDASGNPITVSVPASQTAAGAAAQAQAQQQTASAATAPATGATIIADVRTNTLIVRGTAEQVTQIAELIPNLDKVVPQINVQVRIQEITDTALRSLGVDWKLGFGGFNIGVGQSGLTATFDPTRSLVGFNLGPSLTALENQGMTKRVYDGSVTMQSGQRSLTSASGADNASSNAAASIKSGGRVELNIPSTSGNIVRQIDYGVNLDFFSPQVAPDGTITLRVRGQINQPSSPLPTTGVPNILSFTNSEAQSTITFKSGQTVLMSGLMSTNETSSKVGVPILSSIPLIGAAFGKQDTNRTQTQLLVVITGTVVQ
ncbi:type II secretory pathway component GspD/PulD (secretin) [Deinococcus metalli]|uniref:Type II secretory pathway component GspD/PulD (Secretin) n=1 Tax=Deinococcus metalli TaxID=1141878 RepID=A0A7W8KIG9_9DEIO|nr:secretin N-terminal domain-containing protein [Deinococcus metalli]MBB5377114.1 type II secretory pathway component GspD/PulD (secretin) [Deinococcus metalli]GHF48900.1 putative type IV piliation system protein [Deinococcus metalli]